MDGMVNECENRFLPPEDYDKKGRQKRVRGRMLKPLLKYEFRYLLLPVLIASGALIALSVLLFALGFSVNIVPDPDTFLSYWLPAFILFIYGALFTMAFPVILSIVRYNKNFFKQEGYLTFSIPATAEEHFLAKRISAVCCMLIASVAALLAIALAVSSVFALAGGLEEWQIIMGEVGTLAGYDPFLTVESVLLSIIGTASTFSVCGAFSCWVHRGVKPWMIVLLVVGVYALGVIGETAFLFMLDEEFLMNFTLTPALMHIVNWVSIVLEIGVIVLLSWFEIHTLKKKINLK
ncbi:MAG: hypothetical protein IJX98_02375 [Clostridia bacterium]|nr:hypothetical protein [Clostridia bacterium]